MTLPAGQYGSGSLNLSSRLHLKGVSCGAVIWLFFHLNPVPSSLPLPSLVSVYKIISELPNFLIKMFIFAFSVAAVLLLLLEGQRLCFWMSPPQEWTLMLEEALGTCY